MSCRSIFSKELGPGLFLHEDKQKTVVGKPDPLLRGA